MTVELKRQSELENYHSFFPGKYREKNDDAKHH
jgi:hypothetical protein